MNAYSEKAGSERFWPVRGDFVQEIDKCVRILRAFTVEGVEAPVEEETTVIKDGEKKKAKKKQRILKKISPKVIQEAVGLVIFTSFRTAIAPFGGSGGSGLIVARLPDGSWSAPSSISPNNYAAGFVMGVDIFDAILVIRSQKALETFYGHKATLGTDIGVVAGPLGAGAVFETGKQMTPVFSYVKSRGLYAGISVLGQIFVERYDENGQMYHWPGVKAEDILTGKVRMPREAEPLHQALRDAETGKAQAEKGDGLDVNVQEGLNELVLEDGEVLKLPPTPELVDSNAGDNDPDATKVHYERNSPSTPHSGANTPNRLAPSGPPPPLPSRFKSYASEDSQYSDDGMVKAYEKEKAAGGVHGIGIDEMDESERREYQQYLEMMEQEEYERAKEKRKSSDVGLGMAQASVTGGAGVMPPAYAPASVTVPQEKGTVQTDHPIGSTGDPTAKLDQVNLNTPRMSDTDTDKFYDAREGQGHAGDQHFR